MQQRTNQQIAIEANPALPLFEQTCRVERMTVEELQEEWKANGMDPEMLSKRELQEGLLKMYYPYIAHGTLLRGSASKPLPTNNKFKKVKKVKKFNRV